MKANPDNAGAWPYSDAPADYKKPKEQKPHWAKQDWERVVKKGNSDFNDD